MEVLYKLQPPHEKYSINKNGDIINNISQHKMKEWINSYGYKTYTLRNSNENILKNNLNTHRLLALTFIDNPHNYPCVDHIDRNKKNNSLDNLRWVSYQMNSINKDSNNPRGRGITLSRNKKRFHVNLWRSGKKKWVGAFDTIPEAKIAYTKAVEDWWDEFKS
tara:strand:- start:288 stop:776 length:489 start_codon:yes stop_codon:yes gene_type:complete